ncbi:MAG TPA: hypothetical protein VFS08_10005 [Gemmatimonadaceae bacterium]|nr:hypothetical protein [Gemmatimonadaceae bacterium]
MMVRAALAGAVLLATSAIATAQPAAPPASPSVVEGVVVRPGADSAQTPRPAPGVWVTLHRVGADTAGPVDSVRTDATGHYLLRYPRTADDSAVFFLAARYATITYFSPPLPAGRVSGDAAQLVVYDTTSATDHLQLRGRHIIVGAIDSTRRHPVVEVFEIANTGSATVVSAAERPTWEAAVPPQAQDFRLVSGEISPQAVSADSAGVHVFAPIAPGIKQLSFSYTVPAGDFPIAVALGDSVPLLEVLLEGEAGSASGATLTPSDTVQIEGRTFRRYLASDAPASGVVRISMPAPPVDSRRIYVVAILLGVGLLMLFALGRSVRRPAAVPLGWNGELGPPPEELARRIAALDTAFQRRRDPTPEERQEYERQRGGLKAQLTEALVRYGRES